LKLVLVGNFERGHVGHSLEQAARQLQIQVLPLDTSEAVATPRWLTRINWHLRGHRPPRLERFSAKVVQSCREFEPDILLSTGSAPLSARSLEQIRKLGVVCINYSTDDPWNASLRSAWFFRALRHYNVIFSPRHRNLQQLREIGAPTVEYLPFGYDPELYYPEELDAATRHRLSCDVLFVGGGDPDRLPFIRALIQKEMNVALYGGRWERERDTRPFARGIANPDMIRRATLAAKVNLCLVRRVNRDGHVMRSFEGAAMGACMLAEDTPDHREIFGPEGEAALYFSTMGEMTTKAGWLIANADERATLGRAARVRIESRRDTYRDRLATMLGMTQTGGLSRQSGLPNSFASWGN
jgi:spore maturation protein CgeB